MIDLIPIFGTNETSIERIRGRATRRHPLLAPLQNTDDFPFSLGIILRKTNTKLDQGGIGR
jgi:hypothetical protein